MQKIKKIFQLIYYNGLKICLFRAVYAIQKRTKLLKRKFPSQPWSEIKLNDWLNSSMKISDVDFLQVHKSNGNRFFFDSKNLPRLNSEWKEKIIGDADNLLQNKFCYFFNKTYSLGSKPDWFLNPLTGKRANSKIHWCDIKIFDPGMGDIKFIWEPSRFAWVYTLVRAYAATGNSKYVEKFWTLFESWLDENQPNMGPNYACGQECALRLMAMCFAFYSFTYAPVSTPKRIEKLTVAIVVHAKRIEKNINFAISTRTNHALTEAAALYTIGLLFPEFSRSLRWFKIGKKILTNEGLKQIYPDGSYIQHSMNYHRLMLHTFLWIIRLARLNGDSFCNELLIRLEKATRFLYEMQDETSGRVPNYGPNDGAIILPLNCCDYLDYHPVIQAMIYLFTSKKTYEKGAWDEDLLWLFGIEAADSSKIVRKRQSSKYSYGGYYTLRGENSWAMVRCHTYRDRPSQADMLHLDLWWQGINILRDSGSFMYYCDQPWQHYFLSTNAHNTVSIDGRDQMEKGARFIWYDWLKSSEPVFKLSENGERHSFSGSHFGFKRLDENIIHHRSITMLSKGQTWIIIDEIVGSGMHTTELFWHLANMPFQIHDTGITLKTQKGIVCINVLSQSPLKFSCLNGNEQFPAGFQSLYYAERTSAPTLIVQAKQKLPIRYVTIISLGDHLRDSLIDDEKFIFTNLSGKQCLSILDNH